MTTRTKYIVLVCSVFVISVPLALSGCWKSPPPPLPQGQQTVSGLVKPASISVTRRGTHVLIQGGKEIAYLESLTVDLGDSEGRTVDVTGSYEHNTDPRDLPVIVVVAVKGGSEQTKAWDIPTLGVALAVPPAWNGSIQGKEAAFVVTGAPQPILSVFLENESDLLSSDSSIGDVTVMQTSVDGRRAIRSKNAKTGVERVQVVRNVETDDPTGNVLTLLFTPSGEQEMDPVAWDALVDDVIRSIKFTGEGMASSAASTGTLSSQAASPAPFSGSGAGAPCGGSAGILCPTGFYCEITDMAANVGRCKSL